MIQSVLIRWISVVAVVAAAVAGGSVELRRGPCAPHSGAARFQSSFDDVAGGAPLNVGVCQDQWTDVVPGSGTAISAVAANGTAPSAPNVGTFDLSGGRSAYADKVLGAGLASATNDISASVDLAGPFILGSGTPATLLSTSQAPGSTVNRIDVLVDQAGALQLALWDGTGAPLPPLFAPLSTALPLGSWHTLRLTTSSSGQVALYLDGTMVIQTAGAIASWSAGGNDYLAIGAVAAPVMAATSGQVLVDNVVWNGALFPPLTYRGAVAADGATNFWRLNDTTFTTSPDSIGGVSGSYTGTGQSAVAGPLSGDTRGAVSFSSTGTNEMLTTGSSGLLNLSVGTIELWVSPANITTDEKLLTLASAAYSGNTYKVVLSAKNSALTAEDRSARGTAYYVPFTTSPTLNQWVMLDVVFTGGAVQTYLNGTLYAQTGMDGGLDTANGPYIMSVGGWYGIGYYANAAIADISLYAHALLPGQIAQHYTLGTTATS